MGIYGGFASVYDMLMEDVPYNLWASNIESIWQKHGQKPELVLELGCGTGNLTLCLAGRGYDMIGVDISCDMLSVAREKMAEKNGGILFLQQDMREFELYGTVDSIVSVYDSMNYIMSFKELIKLFKLAGNYLNPGGLFVFEINNELRYSRLNDTSFSRESAEAACIWDSSYCGKKRIYECDAHFFIMERNGLYRRYHERHLQRPYEADEIERAVKSAGLLLLDMLDASTMQKPSGTSERIYYVCREGRTARL